MIVITPGIALPDHELEFRFVRASGPGGQNVNKVATAVQLRFDVHNSPSLPETVKTRLRTLAGRRLSSDGVLVIDARRHRTQERNRDDATRRLAELIRAAATRPAVRIPTRPTRASKQRRMNDKRRAGTRKRLRRTPDPD